MASTSLFGKLIAYEPGEYSDDEAIDTAQARMAASNLAHLADASSQVLTACPPVASGGGFSNTFPASGTNIVLLSTFGPYFLRGRSNGRGYSVRYRLHGRSVTAAEGVEFLVLLHAASAGSDWIGWLREYDATGNAAVQLHTSSSSTPAWVAPDAGNPLLRLSTSDSRLAEQAFSTRDEIGGRASTAYAIEAGISIYARRAAASSATGAELTGFYAAEYYA